jgi:outer membrane protein assembly factor BamA
MTGPSASRLLLFAAALTFALPVSLSAQFLPDLPARCVAPLHASDEFKELIGERVYPKTIIDSVKIDSSTQLPRADRNRLLSWLQRQQFKAQDDWLDLAENRVREAWRDQGYFKAQVTAEYKTTKSNSTYQEVRVSFHVQPGEQYRLQDIRFQNSDPHVTLAFPSDQLRQLISLNDGNIFSSSAIRNGLDDLKNLYASRGYIDFVATPKTQLNEAMRQIAVTLVLDSGSQFRVAKMDFAGGYPDAQAVVRSQLKVGDIYNPVAIEALFRQRRSPFPTGMSLADVVATRIPKDATVDLVFDFRDCPR